MSASAAHACLPLRGDCAAVGSASRTSRRRSRLPQRARSPAVRCARAAEETESAPRVATLRSGGGGADSLVICRVLNGMWQTSGAWGRIDRDAAVDAMLRHADAGLTTFDMADHYGPAEDLYGIFINKVRRERPPELLEEIKG
ncbi:hypothetical protein ACMD2_25085 [Ananas comosus]|nr:hypothetical protein ACMD2_25085 [Ananas comosus]